jgi:inhibitor of KinA
MSNILKFSRYNTYAILVEWAAVIDDFTLIDILNYKKVIEKNYIKQKVEVINTYNSILIIYDFTIDNINDEILSLKRLYKQLETIEELHSSVWEIPVCYDIDFGFDLDYFSKQKKLSKNEVIRLHSSVIYTVYFIGFLPGFLYLGGLHPKLVIDRKSTPNLDIKKGSVAIGGQQTGVYPQNSPGGWYIIGRTPLELFNPYHHPPCSIKAGDKVKFKPISKSEFFNIEKCIAKSTFQFKSISPC